MFDLSLAHLEHADRERERATDLRGRQVLKATNDTTITEAAASHVPAPLHRPTPQRPVKRASSLGR